MTNKIPNTPGGWLPARRAWFDDPALTLEQVGMITSLHRYRGRPVSMAELSKHWRMHRTSVWRHLTVLDRLGYIKINKADQGSRQYHTIYVVWPAE